MTRAEKTEALRELYDRACGYCGTTEADTGGVLTRDHFVPLTCGGRESLGNLVYSCEACNRAKGDYFGGTPETRLLHPRHDDLTAHIVCEPDGNLRALSGAGTTFIAVLNLNRAGLVSRRRFALTP